MSGRFVRLAERQRRAVALRIDGRPVEALEGDTVLVAMLSAVDHIRTSEFDDRHRAGFCLMGACQDCWIWTCGGERLRACSTLVTEGMELCTTPPQYPWSNAP